MSDVENLLATWIKASVASEDEEWFRQQREAVRASGGEQALTRALALAPRRLGRGDLTLDEAAFAAAEAASPGFDPTGLSIDQAARIALLLAAADNRDRFPCTFALLFRTADLQEHIAYLRALAVLPDGERFHAQAGEGMRSGMRPVFEAIAHRNPYPHRHFDEHAWNQLVLKALFIDTTLAPIQGLDERANPDLAVMLVDYAHERRAAGRAISPELWRCVGPFAEGAMIADLEGVLATGRPVERKASALALAASPDPRARALIEGNAEARAFIAGEPTWDSLATEPA